VLTAVPPEPDQTTMHRLRITFVLLSFLLSTTLQGGAASPYDKLSPTIKELLVETGVPGVAVVIVDSEGVVWEAGFGLADVESGMAVTPATPFQVGAIGHSFLGYGIAKLVEADAVRLDERVPDLLPEVGVENPWDPHDPIRVLNLLEHTAGLPDLGPRQLAGAPTGPEEWSGVLGARGVLAAEWRPGSYYAFSNVGPTLAAMILEMKTRTPFNQWVRQNLLDPLGMAATGYQGRDPVSRIATSYLNDGKTAKPWETAFVPSLGAVSSAHDLGRFVQLLLRRGEFGGVELLRRTSLERMETPTSTIAAQQGLQVGCGLGIATFVEGGFVFHGYEGIVNGSRAAFRYLPQDHLGFAICVNSENEEAFRTLLAVLDGAVTEQLAPPQPLISDLPEGRIAAASGYYRPLAAPAGLDFCLRRVLGVLNISYQGGKLQVSPLAGSATTIFPVTDRRFRAEGEPLPTIVFTRDDAGGTVVQAFSGTFHGNYVRASGMAIWGERLYGAFHVGLYLFWIGLAVRWLALRLRAPDKSRGDGLLVLLPGLELIISLSLVGLVMKAANDPVWLLGEPTPVSVGLMVGTWVYGIVALVGAVLAVLKSRSHRDSQVWLFSLVFWASSVVLTAYLAYWGALGIRTWA